VKRPTREGRTTQRVSAPGRHLAAHDVPHLGNVDDHGHGGAAWGSNLYRFARRIFH
jgi:hypothetical protein